MDNIGAIATRQMEKLRNAGELASHQRSGTQSLRHYKTWPVTNQWTGPTVDLSIHPALHLAAQAVSELSKNTAGSVVLAGNPGCGKTLFARILMHAVGGEYRTIDYVNGQMVSGWSAAFYAEPHLLDLIRESYAYEGGTNQLMSKCRSANLLILDDVGAGYVKDNSSEWYDSLMWRFLDGRKDKRTLITTNLRGNDLKDRLGERSFSRLKEMMSVGVINGRDNFISLFDVPDYRANKWTAR